MTMMIYNGNKKYNSKKDCYRVRVAHCLWWIPILSFPNRSFRSGWQVRHTTDPGESLDANIRSRGSVVGAPSSPAASSKLITHLTPPTWRATLVCRPALLPPPEPTRSQRPKNDTDLHPTRLGCLGRDHSYRTPVPVPQERTIGRSSIISLIH